MKTEHQFIKQNPISPDCSKLILGTIHPHNFSEFEIQFFYGNRNSIWKILTEAFPNEFNLNLKSIKEFLKTRKLAISDTILACERVNPTALDKDLKVIEYNYDLINQIKNSKINEILFTSGLSKNNACKIFIDNILNSKITKEDKKLIIQSLKLNREVILDESIFGRPIKLTILYSPSGTANIGISNSKLFKSKAEFYSQFDKPVNRFKVDYYKEKFRAISTFK